MMALDLVQWGTCLFHLCHRKNLSAVLANGLYCKNEMARRKITCFSIADEGIQARRRAKAVSGANGGSVHDYVPLFFAARSPMLYAVRAYGESNILHFLIDWSVLQAPSTVFTDGNASMSETAFFTSATDLQRVDQNALRALWWNGEEKRELRRRKSAEVLVWKHVPVKQIVAIATKTELVANEVRQAAQRLGFTGDVFAAPEFYYP